MYYDDKGNKKENKFAKYLAIGTASAATIALGLKNTSSLEKLSKVASSVSKTIFESSKDLSRLSLKEMTAENLGKVIDKNITGENSVLKNALKNTTISEIDESRGIFGAINDLFNLKNSNGIDNIKSKLLDNIESNVIMNNLRKEYDKESKEFYEQSRVFIQRALREKQQFFEEDENGIVKAIKNEFNDALQGSIIEEKNTFFQQLLEGVLNNNTELSKEVNNEYESVLKPQLYDKLKEEIVSKYSKDKDFFKDTMDNAAKVKDFIESFENDKTLEHNDAIKNLYDKLKIITEEDKRFNELYIDKSLFRVNKDNKLYSVESLTNLKDSAETELSKTIFGKLFGVSSHVMDKNPPNFYYLGQGTFDKVLSSISGEGKENGILKYDNFMLGEHLYRYKNQVLEKIESNDNFYLANTKQGPLINSINSLFGNTYEKPVTNSAAKALDIGTTGFNKWQKRINSITKFKKDSGWYPNIVNRLLDGTYDNALNNDRKMADLYKDLMRMNKMYSDQTFNPSQKFIDEFRKSSGSVTSRMLLDSLNEKDIAKNILNNENLDIRSFKNKDLITLLNKYKNNLNSASKIMRSGELKGKNAGRNVMTFNELLKREVIKESMLREAYNSGQSKVSGYSIVLSKLEDLNVKGVDKKNAKDLLNWSILQNESDIYKSSIHRRMKKSFKEKQYSSVIELFRTKRENAQEQAFMETFQKGIKEFAKNNSSIFEAVNEYNSSYNRPFETGQYVTMRKGIKLTDILKSLNDETRSKSTAKKYVKQFIAGRNSVDDVTTFTMIPYHLANRLTTPLEQISLGFSKNNKKSTFDIIKNIGLKRILPVAGVMYGYSYLNDTSRDITGTSLTAAWQNSKSRFTLGLKTIEDTLGVQSNKVRPMYNPIAKYWGGDYKDKDEYLDYLDNGYTPVRKGRFWDFGSTSEFRGGKIEYFKPNNLRLAHSNYFDVSVYGSSSEKWAHSWIPTPTHPLAPIRRLLDPYWLERKHYWDRPYPMTGKMFTDGTPWGAVLNPTIGAILKPQKKMHKRELGHSLVDVRSIIADINDKTFKKSQERSIAKLDSNGFTTMEYHPLSSPSRSEDVYTVNISNKKIKYAGYLGRGYADSLPLMNTINVNDIQESKDTYYTDRAYRTAEGYKTVSNSENAGQGYRSISLLAPLLQFGKSSGAISNDTSKEMVRNINMNTFSSKRGNREGIINENTTYVNQFSRSYSKKLKTDYLENMIENKKKTDFVHDIFYSASEITGIYGFMAGEVLPQKHGYRLEGANFNSFSNKFWDKSVGGIGGDFMEIARRFFPHKDHSITEINPLVNTMPMWMPERFREGDPYTKVPMGDARLPGRGYETLNKLHSDMYGRYGAFDRYKILGDIAPLSDEYKTWRKVARKEIKDKYLIKQMDEIDKRVKEQTKEHDFYNYKFLGKHLKSDNVLIKTVNDNGTFTTTDDNTVYSLAGITPYKGMMKKYLQPGMNVKLQYENNKYNNRDSQGIIPALVTIGSKSITKQMFEDKTGKEKQDKETLADEYFALDNSNISSGKIYEAIGHAPIPFIHSKFLRIDSPLESYKNEQIYGTNYSTWQHPIKGYLKPAFQKAWSNNFAYQAVGVSTFALALHASESNWSNLAKKSANVLFGLTNPGGFAGAVVGAIPTMSFSSHDTKLNAKNLARVGATVQIAGYAFTHLNNPLQSAFNFAVLGTLAQAQFKFKNTTIKKAALIGTGVGVALSAIKNPDFTLNKFGDKHIPKDTKKKRSLEEYFDRLEYIKYMNLYNKAARMAHFKEHINVKKIVNKFEYNRNINDKKITKLTKRKDSVLKSNLDNQSKKILSRNIDNEIINLQTPIQYFKTGEYTKSALAYKKAADTTLYGLQKYSSTADVLRALPKYDRDYFLEFAKEKDPRKQKKILKYISPYKRKAMQIMWGNKITEKQKSNKNYFKTHKLPAQFWAGWKPQIDLSNIKMKTIKNEGMLLSDFGYYDSQTQEPDYKIAAPINNYDKNNDSNLGVETRLTSLLNGLGLEHVSVRVDKTSTPGLEVITNITRVSKYSLEQKISNFMGNII